MVIVQELFFCKVVSEYWVFGIKASFNSLESEKVFLSKGFLGNNRKKNSSFEGRSVPMFG